ncbi:Helix-loop-helix DNA-binding domain protein [Onchocerca flexuosa]|uniref:Helix-loop-helix DNA-binding domain protein n=1 Tax=Onchocerca flexuosa TaxID=387005 RepID=A0A238BVG2_9BILA|nr:Helix-loop-helix DNA-binding domain protein [Onchocerca flexuosa]
MATIQTIRSKTTKSAKRSKRRREQKKVLEELRKIVPYVNKHTPLLELLQKVIDYIAELQELLNNSSMVAVEDKENISPWRTNELEHKIYAYSYTFMFH